ncbi:MAG TPA: alpha/beta fold hydrolase [Blastocatellia bacterium]|nr:alpha/beta fold hydrolase [Blastocatellia bacterium]
MGPSETSARTHPLQSWKWRIALGYLGILLVSHVVRWVRTETPVADNKPSVTVQAVDGERQVNKQTRLAYREYNSIATEPLPAVILIHGSPGHIEDFRSLAPELAKRCRVIAPDLPGFGSSTADVPDYSIRAHARYVIELMDALGIERVHLLGFSMGGGVALNIADIASQRVQSITMLSAIGVQEAELLGDYHLNHALHGAQLAAVWLLNEAVPHFGILDDSMLGISYARNFYDSDQRPLRGILSRFEQPMLIIHGKHDVLVPLEAAIEHHRIVPQSDAELLDDSHFIVFEKGAILAPTIHKFLDDVEQGSALTRATADTDRLARAALPYDPASVPRAMGVTALVLMMLIAASTLVSEDLTCIGAGVMVAQGRIDFEEAALACFLGIFIGDVLLFLAGRYLGRPALTRAPLKWFVSPEDVERSSEWFNRRGIVVIAASRFVPGMRLPTYFAAGLLNTKLFRFSIYFLLAATVWTPLLVGLSSVLGAEVIESALLARQNAVVQLMVAGVALYLAVRLIIQTSSYRGRRLLVSKWRRMTRWEFWPMWAFYPPVICYVLFLALKHRSLTVFTAANPAMPASGFIGESKLDILRGLSGSNGYLARSSLIDASLDLDRKIGSAKCFIAKHDLCFPVVLKPDQGQRGTGVAIVRSTEEADRYLSNAPVDTIIQEYAPGSEFGVFYCRRPNEKRGRIFSITEKRMPAVTGDGVNSLEKLILADDRAVCMARFLLDKHAARAGEVPAEGERVQLVEIGTHCKGALFLDGSWIKTPELETRIDEISRSFDGFYFGRFDIRTPSVDDFRAGRNFKIVELNGVTSEATHIYDPRNSLIDAYRILFEQWRLAFEIGAKNRERGVKLSSLRELLKGLTDYRMRPRPSLR